MGDRPMVIPISREELHRVCELLEWHVGHNLSTANSTSLCFVAESWDPEIQISDLEDMEIKRRCHWLSAIVQCILINPVNLKFF